MSEAVVFTEYGPPEVLHVVDLEPREPGPREVRVRVRAAGVQPFDNLFRSGATKGYVPAKFPQQTGNELAGVVESIGAEVTEFREGDEVLGWVALAAFAEHAIVPADQLVAKPTTMPWAEAGALSASGQTAHTALAILGVTRGETVLIHAAAGGVGSMAVQIAVAQGAHVIGTASARNHDYLCGLRAIPVQYGDGLLDRVPSRPDAVLDAIGTDESLRASAKLASRIGTVAFNPLAAQLGVRQLSTDRSTRRLQALVDLYEAGQLRVHVQSTYGLREAAAAHREVETGHVRGKVVLMP
ncbi:NADP-dependent oxidoreductase [Tenggerimyces flavus]|uniref:NADP-dependent oxidoreductase n=1 Tax=Tenggerimyces flavus TaxID=1708749 RepID=A0ABV7Y8J4_9ACTN|nr:NADP-dependent oxidoreductase [Tenggerimyces flavus]MBM7785132.1 enoyl reductase [Tenggerimyces flavus]